MRRPYFRNVAQRISDKATARMDAAYDRREPLKARRQRWARVRRAETPLRNARLNSVIAWFRRFPIIYA